jgi:hypothetical protein
VPWHVALCSERVYVSVSASENQGSIRAPGQACRFPIRVPFPGEFPAVGLVCKSSDLLRSCPEAAIVEVSYNITSYQVETIALA